MRIGIFGGSFNPIHVGHISLVRQLRRLGHLDEVWLMVSPQNPLKQGSTDLLDDHLRLQMAQIALQGEEGVVASDFEFGLPKPSYTWNTLQCLGEKYPGHEFVLLIGGDNWTNFHHWYRADDILREHQIVVYPREGSDIDRCALPANVTLVNTRLLNVSSTEVRERVLQGRGIKRLVPSAIEPLVRQYYSGSSTATGQADVSAPAVQSGRR